MNPNWSLRSVTFVLAAVLAASVVFWGLKFSARTTAAALVPAVSAQTQVETPDIQAVTRTLGGNAVSAQPPATGLSVARFVLRGVVAAPHGGAALIAVDGKAAKPYAVGSVVADSFRLLAVGARHAVLGAEEKSGLRIELPAAAGKAAPAN